MPKERLRRIYSALRAQRGVYQGKESDKAKKKPQERSWGLSERFKTELESASEPDELDVGCDGERVGSGYCP